MRLNSDREYLKQLEAALAVQQDGDVLLRYNILVVVAIILIYFSREKITSTVQATVEFLQEREQFWDAFDWLEMLDVYIMNVYVDDDEG